MIPTRRPCDSLSALNDQTRQPPPTTAQHVISGRRPLAGLLAFPAARNLASRRPFSYSMKSPATPRLILRLRSSLSVRSSPEAKVTLSQQRNAPTVVGAPLVAESQPPGAPCERGRGRHPTGGSKEPSSPGLGTGLRLQHQSAVRNPDAANELQGGRPEAHLKFKFVCFVFKMRTYGETHSSQRELSLNPLSRSVTLISWRIASLLLRLSDGKKRPSGSALGRRAAGPEPRGRSSHATARFDGRQECRLLCRRFADCRWQSWPADHDGAASRSASRKF